MSNYNKEILEIIPEFINRIVDDLNRTNDNGITNLDYEVTGTEDTSISNYLTHQFDAYYEFLFTYKFNEGDYNFKIRVPKEVGGVFIVDGKLRVPYNELVTDFRMKYHKGRLKIDKAREVILDKNGNYILSFKGLNYNLSNQDTYSQIPTEALELDEELRKLAMAKVFYAPNLIDSTLCKELFKYGESQGKFSNLVDVTIVSTASYVKKRLNMDYLNFMSQIRYKFKGGNKFRYGLIYSNDINNKIMKYFSISEGNFNYFNNVTNPLTLQALSTQVKVPYGNSLNSSIFDVIDVVDTPINNNINKINYMNRNVKVVDGKIMIQVYDKDKNRVWIDKLDYCTSNILVSEAWNYDEWKLNGKYKGNELPVKLGVNLTAVNSLDEIDYIELDPNDRTSITSHVVPMINKSELGRMAMGTSMIKQGVTLINADDPRVTTTDLTELVKLNPLIIVADFDGKVSSVTRTSVTISGKDGSKSYKIPYALKSYQDNLVPFIPVVKEGQVVSKGDILISPSNISQSSVKYGINAIAAFNPYFGYNSDDAVVISESFAEKLSSMYSKSQIISVKNVSSIKYMSKGGTKVNSGDILMTFTMPASASKYKDILEGDVTPESNLIHRVAMNNLIDAYIYEINLAMGSKVQLDDESYQIIDELNKDIDISPVSDVIPLTPSKSLMPQDNEILIEIKFLMKRKAVVGDKITNRYGNKGEIAKIVPDKDMIISESGLIADICFSRESLPSRKNISQIYELYLGQISQSIEDLWNKSDDDKVRAVGVYNTLFKTNYSTDEFSDLVRKQGKVAFSARVKSYSNLTTEEVIKAIDDLGLNINQNASIKGRKLANKVLFGPMYIIKLPYLPEDTLSVTASSKLMGIDDPLLGLGRRRAEGQKLGEMESTALSVNSPRLLEYYKSIAGVNSQINRLYFDFLDLGLDISGIANKVSEKANEVSEDSLDKLKDKFNGSI